MRPSEFSKACSRSPSSVIRTPNRADRRLGRELLYLARPGLVPRRGSSRCCFRGIDERRDDVRIRCRNSRALRIATAICREFWNICCPRIARAAGSHCSLFANFCHSRCPSGRSTVLVVTGHLSRRLSARYALSSPTLEGRLRMRMRPPTCVSAAARPRARLNRPDNPPLELRSGVSLDRSPGERRRGSRRSGSRCTTRCREPRVPDNRPPAGAGVASRPGAV